MAEISSSNKEDDPMHKPSVSVLNPRSRKKHSSDGDVTDLENYGESQWLNYDEIDALPPSLRFNWFDIMCILFSIFTYMFDIAMDCYVAYIYYSEQFIGYFVLTLIFVLIPAGLMSAFSLRWYIMDLDNHQSSVPKPSCSKWVIRMIFLLLQMAPVLRYFDSLYYGLKSRKAAAEDNKALQIKWYTYMINEDADSTLLRLFEGFMESAPQVCLQLFILIYHFNDSNGPFSGRNYQIQVLAIFSSLVSLAWSLSSYHRSLRYSQPDKPNISYCGTLLQFTFFLCSISSRIFCLGVFSATYPILILPVCIGHWLLMLCWLIIQGNQACSNHCEETLLSLVVAFIYIFTFFNISDEPTKNKYLIFYSIFFFENSILLFTWFFSFNISTPEIFWFRICGLVGDYILFFTGIACMILYYSYFHPTKSLNKQSKIKLKDCRSSSTENVPARKTEFLTRKGSLDQNHLAIANQPQNAPSKRNVTFAMDLEQKKNQLQQPLTKNAILLNKDKGSSSSSFSTANSVNTTLPSVGEPEKKLPLQNEPEPNKSIPSSNNNPENPQQNNSNNNDENETSETPL